MLRSGLVSVTFRRLQPRAIVDLVARAGLWGIEWGGDVHVPPGDLRTARAVRAMTLDSGLAVAAYGSYFRFRPDDSFEQVLETAVALQAPLIRVWAGDRASADAGATYHAMIAAESRRVAALAAQAGIAVAYEYHGNTLTDTTSSALDLLAAAPAMRTLWQPPHHLSEDQRIASLEAVLPRLANVHAFWWGDDPRTRYPLHGGASLWRRVLELLARREHQPAILLEFVRDDDPQQFLEDAATLTRWIHEVSS